ncbi:hypothetical protein L218DRAFT_1043044 [Marasmius fiardii PR-910]|nr:hypothetical protein L218DRAFT_1043044 [Marasmius fiardii PR-910]
MVATRRHNYEQTKQTSPANTRTLLEEVARLSSAASIQEEDTGTVMLDGDGILASPWQMAPEDGLCLQHPPRLSQSDLYLARCRMSLSASPEADRVCSGLRVHGLEGEMVLSDAQLGDNDPDSSDWEVSESPIIPSGLQESEHSHSELLLPEMVSAMEVAPVEVVSSPSGAPTLDDSMVEVGGLVLPGHLSVDTSKDDMVSELDAVGHDPVLIEYTQYCASLSTSESDFITPPYLQLAIIESQKSFAQCFNSQECLASNAIIVEVEEQQAGPSHDKGKNVPESERDPAYHAF